MLDPLIKKRFSRLDCSKFFKEYPRWSIMLEDHIPLQSVLQ
jgi:hypothetical protein